ncbi:MAG: hypothetical protein NE327_12395 [Lentisphaeraceae bacterium]|nr:hypothetical protein [Lentisphaeraceae bacterium]
MFKSFKQAGDFVEKTFQDNAVLYQRDFTVEFGGDVAKDTPVDTGKATANWQGSVNKPNTNSVKKYDQTINAGPTKSAINNAVKNSKYGDVLYVSNGVVGEDENGNENGEGYIIGLDNGTGSNQAPQGMVGPNLARAKEISRRALKK